MVEPKTRSCGQHPGFPLEFYCCDEACAKEICKKCIPEHPKHHIVLNEATEKPAATTGMKGATTVEDMTKGSEFIGDLLWSNGTKTLKHESKEHTYLTVTSKTRLPAYFVIQIKVVKLKEESGTFIGMSRRNVNYKEDYRLCREDDNQYAFCNFAGGRLFSHCDEWKRYGCTYGEGDTITIKLDREKTLSFEVNGEKCGPGFQHLKGYFYLALTTNCPGNTFEIMHVKKL